MEHAKEGEVSDTKLKNKNGEVKKLTWIRWIIAYLLMLFTFEQKNSVK